MRPCKYILFVSDYMLEKMDRSLIMVRFLAFVPLILKMITHSSNILLSLLLLLLLLLLSLLLLLLLLSLLLLLLLLLSLLLILRLYFLDIFKNITAPDNNFKAQ